MTCKFCGVGKAPTSRARWAVTTALRARINTAWLKGRAPSPSGKSTPVKGFAECDSCQVGRFTNDTGSTGCTWQGPGAAGHDRVFHLPGLDVCNIALDGVKFGTASFVADCSCVFL